MQRNQALPARLLTRSWTSLACLLLGAVSAALAASDSNTPIEYVDEQTGVTVTLVSQPLVFAHEYKELNREPAFPWDVNADYVTLAGVAVNRQGKIRYFLIAYFWGTGREPRQNPHFAGGPMVLQLQDRRIELTPLGISSQDVGISEPPHRPAIERAAQTLYAIDLLTMGLIPDSARPVLLPGGEPTAFTYQLVEDRLAELRDLVRYLNETS